MNKKLSLLMISLMALAGCGGSRRGSSSTTSYSDSSISDSSISESSSSSSSESSSSSSEQSSSSSSSEEMSSSLSESSSLSTSEAPLIQNEIIRRVAYARNKYAPITAEELAELTGINDSDTITISKLFHLIAKGFEGYLPEVIGARGYQGDFNSHVVTRTLNEQEKHDYRYLKQYGLIAEDIDPDEIASLKYTLKFLARIHAYIGESYQDDFAYTVNKEFMYTKDNLDGTKPTAQAYGTNLIDSNILADNAFNLLKEAGANKSYSNLQFIVDAFEEDRKVDLASHEQSQYFIARWNELTDMDSLFLDIKEQFKKTATSPLISFNNDRYLTANGPKGMFFLKTYKVDHTSYLSALLMDYACDYASFMGATGPSLDIYFKEIKDSYKLEDVTYNALKENVLSFLKDTADYLSQFYYSGWEGKYMNFGSSSDPIAIASSGVYHLYPFFEEAELKVNSVTFNAAEYYLLRSIGNMMVDATKFNELKAFFLFNYLANNLAIAHKYNDKKDKTLPIIMSAYNLLDYYQHTARYKDAVKASEELFSSIITTLKDNADYNGWLSDKGIIALKDKADAVRHSLYGEFDGKDYDYASSIIDKFNDDLIWNYSLYTRNVAHIWADWSYATYEGTMSLGEEVQLLMEPFTPNAFYFPYTNSYYMTMGYLFSKGDSFSEYSLEYLLGTFGLVMGHEITHGFDSNGCYFDKDGNYTSSSIFPRSDLYAYQAKQREVINLYDYEVMPGEMQSGETTLSEDLADIGGLGIMLGIADKTDAEFDYEKFYIHLGENFMSKCTHASYEEEFINDVHAFGAGRLNPLMKSRAKFMETFDVTEWDNMYRDPTQEIIIW